MMLYRTLDAVMPAFRAIFHEFGLTEQQWRIFRVLWENDGRSLRGLAADTLISEPSLVGIVDRLERDGLVRRERSPDDRRVVNIYLTAPGRRLEREVRPRVEAAYKALESSIDPAQLGDLYAAMEAIIEAVPDKTGIQSRS